MTDLLHPLTGRQLKDFIGKPSHAVAVIGPGGAGKVRVADRLAEELLKQPLEDYPYKLRITAEDGKSIGIEAVRQLEHFFSLKVPRSASVNRIVIIEDAHLLTLEAQNSLLKTLEEPPAGSVLILTSAGEQALLPTVRSRLQTITVKRPGKPASEQYFAALGYSQKDIDQAYAISGGLTGLMQALLGNTSHPLLEAVKYARLLLSQSAYERLLLVDELAKDRELSINIADILQQMADISLQTATGAAAKKWQSVLEAAYQASEALGSNAQPKLVLTRLMLKL